MALKVYSGHDFVTETGTYKVQRGITKIYIYPRVMVLAPCMSVNICMKFHEDTLNGLKVIERT